MLVFGAGTDYALLLVARYREELRRHEDRHEAMAIALHRAGPAIIASGSTVIVGMLCLLLAQMNSTASMGPALAIGVAVGLLAMLSLLPALLVITGRWVFWPVRPRYGSADRTETGVWARMGHAIAPRPRAVWVTTAVILGALSLGLFQLDAQGLSYEESFIGEPESIVGLQVLNEHYDASAGEPVIVIANADQADEVQAAFQGTDGIAAEQRHRVAASGRVRLPHRDPDGPGRQPGRPGHGRGGARVRPRRRGSRRAGGRTDRRAAGRQERLRRDNAVIIPVVLIVVFLILALLLRAVVAPLVLIATVVLSFLAAFGLSALLFRLFGFEGADAGLPLLVFVFLVALGIDYNIFLMTRVHEESKRYGTRRGALIGLATTGGVITSAGLVLAGTFAVLASLPVVAFAEVGIVVAIGVLLDTIVVRSVLVTALNLDIGRRMWWPSALARMPDVEEVDTGLNQPAPVD